MPPGVDSSEAGTRRLISPAPYEGIGSSIPFVVAVAVGVAARNSEAKVVTSLAALPRFPPRFLQPSPSASPLSPTLASSQGRNPQQPRGLYP